MGHRRRYTAQLAALLGTLAIGACGADTPAKTEEDGDLGQDESSVKDEPGEDEDDDAPVDAGKKPPKSEKDSGSAPSDKDAGSKTEPKPSADAGAAQSDASTGVVAPPPGESGPSDGDPSKPVVSLPDVACFKGGGSSINPLGAANLKVGGRDVILSYPCEKHEGANVTFILNLHGTMPTENLKFYQHGYFAAHNLATSHNLIVATPKSRASQWGNTGENPAASEDRGHLLEVVDYVYKNFSKFNITSMWVGGHSWGSMYAKRFVCEAAIKDKARGVIGMSGGATLAGGRGFGATDLMTTTNCADYISQIHTVGDKEMLPGVPDQTAVSAKHGCGAKAATKDLGNMQMMDEWPDCDPGWVHENITMGAHEHTTAINPEVVKHIVEKIKATEKR